MSEPHPPLGFVINELERAATDAAGEAARLDDPNMLFVNPKDIARHDLRARCLREAAELLRDRQGAEAVLRGGF